MKLTISTLLVLALFVFAGSVQAAPQSKTILNNVLTLVLAFGDKDVPDEFLLADPVGLTVALNGDIIVNDETKLKVFNSNGKPKQIIGRKGLGPGEFSQSITHYCSEDGYISVKELPRRYYNFFSPEYKFIEQINTSQSEYNSELMKLLQCDQIVYDEIYLFKDKSMIFVMRCIKYSDSSKQPQTIEKKFNAVVKKEGNKYISVYQLKQNLPTDDIFIASPTFGDVTHTFLSESIVAYSDPLIHRKQLNGKWYYTIVIQNIKTGEKREIQHEYVPVPFAEDFMSSMKNSNQIVYKSIEKLKYYAPIKFLDSDGDYIFAYKFNKPNETGYVTDVFRASNGEYLNSVYLPFRFNTLKNGYGYRIKSSKTEYPQVEKYRIDPKVYGK